MNTPELYRRFQLLQTYVGWTDEDAQLLRAAGRRLAPHFPALIEDFYDEINRHAEARKVITGGAEQIERLKRTLLGWMNELFSGVYDEDYVARRWRVGWRHVEIGLDQEYTNAAMSRLRGGMTRAVHESWSGDADALMPTAAALHKLLDLDLAIIEGAYHAERTARLAQANRELRTEVSERRRAERELRLLQDLTLAVAAAPDLPSALELTLRKLCKATGWCFGEVWLPRSDGRVLRNAALWHPPEDASFADFAALTRRQEIEYGAGVPGRIWQVRRSEWIDNLDSSHFLRSGAAARAGLCCGAAVPVLAGDDIVAVMCFFLDSPQGRDQRLLDLVAAAVAPLGPVIQRKQTEGALAESERLVRNILQRIQLVGIVLNHEGRITFCNDHLLKLTGWREDDLLGHDWFETAVPPEHRESVRGMFAASIAAGRMPPQFENPILTRSGEERLIAWSNVVNHDASGRIVGVTALGLDITIRRRLEEELAKHRHQLEQLVQQRTAELAATHEQLRHADRLASIGTLAAGLGHDMNNVLLPIRARLDALDAANLPDIVQRQFVAVRRSVEYLQQLSDGLHLLALDPEDTEASGETTNLHQWWTQVGSLLVKAVPKHVTFQCDLAEDLPAVSIAPHRLTQAVLNLVVNAGEAIHEEGIVRVWAKACEMTSCVCLGVTDTGEGMSPDVKKHALDPFFTTKKRGLGTGLGLSLVHGVTNQAGGDIHIESKVAKGTTVTLTLPMAGAAIEEPPPRRLAAVTVADARAATFISAMLSAGGLDVNFAQPSPRAFIWVLDPAVGDPEAARRFINGSGDRRLILFGSPPSPDDLAWRDIDAAVIDDPDDFESIRETIGRIVLSELEIAP